jgi:hypothetical protein
MSNDRYSMRIRQDLAESLAGQESEGIVFSKERSEDYRTEIAAADFCPVLPGDGWSARMEDAVAAGCVPVIIQDEVLTPWEGWLDVSKYSLRVAQADAPRLVETLRAVPPETRAELRRGLARVWHRYVWSGAFRAEKARCDAGEVRCTVAGLAAAAAPRPDAFDTLMQVLGAKMKQRTEPAEVTDEAGDAGVEGAKMMSKVDDRAGFTATEREVQAKAAAAAADAADDVSSWLREWQCVPDDEHAYPDAPLTDHCSIPDEDLPDWLRRDPHVERLAMSGEIGGATHGLALAAQLAGKRVLVNGDSVAGQFFAAWQCDLKRALGAESAVGEEDVARRDAFDASVRDEWGMRPIFVGGGKLAEGLAKWRRQNAPAAAAAAAGPPVTAYLRRNTRLRDWETAEVGPLRETLRRLDVLILAVGAHYGSQTSHLREDFERLGPELDAFAAQPGKAVLVMEVGTTHFPGSVHGGYKNRDAAVLDEKGCFCAPVDDADADPTNAAIRSALAGLPNVRLFPFRKLTAPRFAMHFKRRVLGARGHEGCDCLHWCYSPPFWRTVMGSVKDALAMSQLAS